MRDKSLRRRIEQEDAIKDSDGNLPVHSRGRAPRRKLSNLLRCHRIYSRLAFSLARLAYLHERALTGKGSRVVTQHRQQQPCESCIESPAISADSVAFRIKPNPNSAYGLSRLQ